MKRITLFLAVCLGLSVFQTAFAVDSETARAANKRTSTNTITTNTSATRGNTSNTKQKSDTNRNENARTTVNKNARQSATVKNRAATNQHVVKQRPAASTQQKNIVSRTNAIQRTVSASRSATRKPASGKTMTARTAATSQKGRISRAAALDNDKIAEIKSKDYSKCKTVYQECMDEFCANKDTTLRRCACSSRIHEFDGIKKQLTDAEDKMTEFNQRLLTVGMDKEDALSINSATEGELAFSKTDTSDSEKLLQKITQTLNNSGDSKIANNLSSISLDLDIESAWDTIDATGGMSTTAKSGLDLYNAAQPVCVEMAQEVCSAEELDIAERSYKLAIQNDCNTVSKAYSSQYNKAMDKIHESGALLDMARLNAYQQRNSDDILTCKRKMLEQLSDSSVCGENLYKCLDITGQYIDPSTGNAFLSNDLINITSLLTVPDTDAKWATLSANKSFVNFLNSKKMFLETATEQCQDLADSIWNDFLEDALARIKSAQNAKLESVRQNCVTLIAECKSNAHQSLEDFDARALSIFAIAADTTVNTMCKDVQDACLTLVTDSGDWVAGITGMSSDISTDKMLENCVTVGKTCFLQKCKGINGDFTLCNKKNDVMRYSILNRNLCWQDVFNCVAQATNIDYSIGIDDSAEPDPYLQCDDIYTNEKQQKICHVAHKIWGDCDYKVTMEGDNTINTNQDHASSLLKWFADQTNENCNGYECSEQQIMGACSGICEPAISAYQNSLLEITYKALENATTCPDTLPEDLTIAMRQLPLSDDLIYAYCPDGCTQKDYYGNCCLTKIYNVDEKDICIPNDVSKATPVRIAQCTDTSDPYYCADGAKQITAYCMNNTGPTTDQDTGTPECPDGKWVLVDSNGNYFSPSAPTEVLNQPVQYYPIYTYPKGVVMATFVNPSYNKTSHSVQYNPFQDKWVECTTNVDPSYLNNCLQNYTGELSWGPAHHVNGQHSYIHYFE